MLEETGGAVVEPHADRAQAALHQLHRRPGPGNGLRKKLPDHGFARPPATRSWNTARLYGEVFFNAVLRARSKCQFNEIENFLNV